MTILENLKQAYLFKANYCLNQNISFCFDRLTEEFIETINSKEFSSFSHKEIQMVINNFKIDLYQPNELLEYKKAS